MSRSRGDAQLIKVMEGVRVLRSPSSPFVPAAGAILADWGAGRHQVGSTRCGDTQRGFINMGGLQTRPRPSSADGTPQPGQRSVGIDVSTPEGQEVLYEIARSADVFLTNYLPPRGRRTSSTSSTSARRTPDIIYARGSAYGDKGARAGRRRLRTAPRSGRVVASAGLLPPEALGGALSQGIPFPATRSVE